MTTMISELYEALINAGATEEKAREAAVALACMDAGGRAASGTKAGTTENLNSKDNVAEVKAELAGDIAGLDEKLSGRIAALDEKLSSRITALDEKLSGRIAALDKKMAVMQWMMGTTLAGVAAILASVVPILVKLFFVA